MNGVSFPVKLSYINKIEEANNLNIFVYEYSQKHGVLPVRSSQHVGGIEINLLYITCGLESHYALISNKSGFFRDIEHNTRQNFSFWCPRCIKPFRYERCFKEHLKACESFQMRKTIMPTKPIMKFDQESKTIAAPCYVVCDFETLSVPDESGALTSNNTTTLTKCKPISFVLKVCSDYPQYDRPPVVFVGENAAKEFIFHINLIYRETSPLIFANFPATPLTEEEKWIHYSSPCCHICKEPFDPTEGRVLDHDHYPLKEGKTSNYLGPAHNSCNLRRSTDKHLPVIFHNLSGFDIHLFFKELCDSVRNVSEIKIINKTSENYLQVKSKKFHFIDSCKHIPGPLEKLAKNLPSSKLVNLKYYCESTYSNSQRKFELLSGKLVFCYKYITSAETLVHPIPERRWFTSLDDVVVSDEKWSHLQEVINEFNIKFIKDLLVLYNIVDTLLLADVWATYREECLVDFGLEPTMFIGGPSFTFAAALKMTGIKLPLLQNSDIYNLYERGIRGGITVINKRRSVANNPYVGYDHTKPQVHIIYLDCVNLYGKSMTEMLPHSGFRLEEPSSFSEEQILTLNENGNRGFTFEVDLTIPEEVHDDLNDYPIAPSKLVVTQDIISPQSKLIRQKVGLPEKFKSTKLAPNFFDKVNYVVALGNLKFYLSKGAKITKVHKVVSFIQKCWMKPYIDFVSQKRRQTTCEFERLRYKTFSNACFGKFLQNCRNYTKIKLVKTPDQHRYQTIKPEFKSFSIFTETLAAVELHQTVVTLDKPVYCGFAILESSKLIMYQIFYDVIRKQWPTARLLFTDTDSLMIEVTTETLQDDLRNIKQHMDFSNLDPGHQLYSTENKDVPGKFKSEVKDADVAEFIGLRSKMYSIKLANGKDKYKKAAAGVKKSVAQTKLTHNMFGDTLNNLSKTITPQKFFRSHNHDMFLINIEKTSLSAYDDKRYILPDNISTLSYGHKDIP